MIGEFVGTTMFLFFAFAGTQVANAGAQDSGSATNATNGFSPIILLYTAVSFGFSLMVNVWIFFRISGGKLLHHVAGRLKAFIFSGSTMKQPKLT